MKTSPKFLKVKIFFQFLILYKMAYSDFPKKRLSVAVEATEIQGNDDFSTQNLKAHHYWLPWQPIFLKS